MNNLPSFIAKHLKLFAAIIIIFIGTFISCKKKQAVISPSEGRTIRDHEPPENSTISWNVLFEPGTNQADRNIAFANIEKSIKSYLQTYNTTHGTNLRDSLTSKDSCICDSLLYNINYQFLQGNGPSGATPPPPPPGPGGKGDFVNVKFVSVNQKMEEKKDSASEVYVSNVSKVNVKQATLERSVILGVIDTGLDTTLFNGHISQYLWHDIGRPTIYNFMAGATKPFTILDDHKDKHGSAVTAIIFQQMEKKYPQLMVLKALDSNKTGSVFSVSCALSYAIQHHANVINASLGYNGKLDSVFWHYFKLANDNEPNPILTFVSAGNTPPPHRKSKYRQLSTNNNEIRRDTVFPACFSTTMTRSLTSVTGLSSNNWACYYQNFSERYISLGVLCTVPTLCCQNKVGFNSGIYEGSSFATPVATGKLMNIIMQTGFNTNATNKAWQKLITHPVFGPHRTVDGHYIEYTPHD